MAKIITTKQLQQKIGQIGKLIGEHAFIVTNRGDARFVILPYYDGCDEIVEDYMEDFEMFMNKDALEKEWAESIASGESDLVI